MQKQKGRNGARRLGTLIIVGGHEDKEGDKLVLRAIAAPAEAGALVVVTVASEQPAEMWAQYRPLFRDLGVRDVRHLHVDTREEARADDALRVLDGASVVFFTGGDQLKLTSQLGDTPIYQRTREIYEAGGTIAGTSAGASVMCETMMVSGNGEASPRIDDALRMAPGFGFLRGAIVDQHFAERGRIGRLIGAVAQNPRVLGIGVDEDTAIVCDHPSRFTVLGAGAVYVVDGRDVTHSNLVADQADKPLSVFDLRLHLLNMGDAFDLVERRPTSLPIEAAEAAVPSNGARKRRRVAASTA